MVAAADIFVGCKITLCSYLKESSLLLMLW